LKSKVLLFGDPDSIHTAKWLKGWNLLGYDTYLSGLSAIRKNSEFIFYGNISSSGGNGLSYFKNIFQFLKILKQVDPSIINAHYLTSYGLISALIKRKKDILIMSLHGTDIMKTMDKNFAYLFMAKYTLYKSDLIVSVSEAMTNKILKKFPSLEKKILTQQYGVEIKLLNNFNNQEKDIFLLTNRQWKKNSNYPVILKVVDHFKTKNIKIIGFDKSVYSRKLVLNFKNFKKYSTGLIPYEENLKYVGKSKIFVSLTSSDGISLSLIEAMYLGAIPIVSNIEPNKELIEDRVNGFLVSISEEDLITKIQEVSELTEIEISAIQCANKKLVLQKFDINKNFNNLKKTIIQLNSLYDR